jgi:3-phenylpropionate/trans-cinnamate dioxygenase ferredoxin reductase subunit
VHELRTLEDTARFRAEVGPGTKVVVIGGGYVGLEAASAGVEHGADVTIVEAQPRLLARVTGPEVADYLLQRHREAGAHVELGAMVAGISESDGVARGVLLADGREIEADVVLVSVGVRPASAVLDAAGARCSNGVEIDLQGRTSLPDIFAAGDCTCFPRGDGSYMRLESLQNAVEQGDVVAKTILGEETSYEVVPYFWSNQCGVKIKTIGLFNGYDESLVRADPTAGTFSVVYLKDGRVCAVDSINAMKDYVDARKIVGSLVDHDLARDPSTRLRDAVVETQADDEPL